MTKVVCPHCQSELALDDAGDRTRLCAQCGKTFRIENKEDHRRLSRKALLSCLLGLSSIVGLFFTGIPAVLLGALAFRDISREPTRLRGRAYAVVGVLCGAGLGLFCSPITTTVVVSTVNLVRLAINTGEPQQVRALAKRMGAPPPPGLIPVRANRDGIDPRMLVIFQDKRKGARTTVMVLERPQGHQTTPFELPVNREIEARHLELNEPVIDKHDVSVWGRTVQVERHLGKRQETGKPLEMLRAELDRTGTKLVIVQFTAQAKRGDPKKRLSRFTQWLQSIEESPERTAIE